MESVRELNRDKPMKLASSRWGLTAYEMFYWKIQILEQRLGILRENLRLLARRIKREQQVEEKVSVMPSVSKHLTSGEEFSCVLRYSSSTDCPCGHHRGRQEHPWQPTPWQRCLWGGKNSNVCDASVIFEVSDEPTSCTAEAVEKSGKWCGKGPEFELMDTPGDMTHFYIMEQAWK